MANELEKTLLGTSKRSVNNTIDKNSTYIEQKKLHRVYITSLEPESPTDGEIWFDTTGNNMDLYPETPYEYDGVYGPVPISGKVNLKNYASKYISNYTTVTEIPKENLKYLKSGLIASYADRMFYKADNISKIDLSSFNIDWSQTNGNYESMFESDYISDDKSTTTYIDASCLNNATSFYRSFLSRESLKTIILPKNFACTDFTQAFTSCEELEEIDLSGLEHGIYINLDNTFADCYKLKSILGLGNVYIKNLNFTFSESGLEKIDLSNSLDSNTPISSFFGTFSGCTSLTKIIGLDKINTTGIIGCKSILNGCTSLMGELAINLDTTNIGNTDKTLDVTGAMKNSFNKTGLSIIKFLQGFTIPIYDVESNMYKNILSYQYCFANNPNLERIVDVNGDDIVFDLHGSLGYSISIYALMFAGSLKLHVYLKDVPNDDNWARTLGLSDGQYTIVE